MACADVVELTRPCLQWKHELTKSRLSRLGQTLWFSKHSEMRLHDTKTSWERKCFCTVYKTMDIDQLEKTAIHLSDLSFSQSEL